MSNYAPGAVYIQIMLLEHIELRILPQIIHAPGAAAPGAAAPGAAVPGAAAPGAIISGQNLTEASTTIGPQSPLHSAWAFMYLYRGYFTLSVHFCKNGFFPILANF